MTTYNQALQDAALVCEMIANKIAKDAKTVGEITRANYAKEILNFAANSIKTVEPGFVRPGDEIPDIKKES